LRAERARDDIGRAGRRVADDDAYRLGRILLRKSASCDQADEKRQHPQRGFHSGFNDTRASNATTPSAFTISGLISASETGVPASLEIAATALASARRSPRGRLR